MKPRERVYMGAGAPGAGVTPGDPQLPIALYEGARSPAPKIVRKLSWRAIVSSVLAGGHTFPVAAPRRALHLGGGRALGSANPQEAIGTQL